jgi:hypothetical protein
MLLARFKEAKSGCGTSGRGLLDRSESAPFEVDEGEKKGDAVVNEHWPEMRCH